MQKSALVLAFLMALAIVPSTAAEAPRTHSVDYVIGMLEAGVPSRTIIARIHAGPLAFTLGEGDVDRLREAGAGDALIRAVEESAGARRDAPRSGAAPDSQNESTRPPEQENSQSWGRPQRLADPQETPGGTGENLEGDQRGEDSGSDRSAEEGEAPHGGYPYYRPGDDDAYGYPYGPSYSFAYGYPYYDPFFVPYDPFYYSYYGFYSPYYRYNHGPGFRYYHRPGRVVPRGSGRFAPRGSGGGRPSGGAPRSHVSPRSHH